MIGIGAWAFNECANLAMVSFADRSALKVVGEGAFRGTALNRVELPRSTKVDENAFDDHVQVVCK